jgi:GNAT superfamily N-acetyltransferase
MIYLTEIKTFAELSKQELEVLKKLNKRNGAFRELLSSLENNKIQFPENIFLALAKKDEAILGWAMLDCSREYNPKAEDPTVMVYVKFDFRRRNIGTTLVECLGRINTEKKKVSAYVWKNGRERRFFKKVAKKLNQNIEVNNPRVYFGK